MLQKRHNSVITFFILLALIGVSKPAKVLAQSNAVEDRVPQTNLNFQDSGIVNPEFENSGTANSEVEGSGEPEFNTVGSGEVNPEFENSGVIDLNTENSGETNPGIEDSGKPISPTQINRVETAESFAQLAEPEDEVVVEDEDNNSGLWWTLLLLLPLAALALYLFSRGKKSDREPAIGTMPDPNNPSGGLGVPTGTNRDNLYATNSNLSGGVDNVPNIGTTSSLGGTALAEGAAATSNLVDENRNLDGDRVELETKSDLVVEIPSNPVSEFTTTEARLQTTEQPTEVQTDDGDNDSTFALRDNVSLEDMAIDPVVEQREVGNFQERDSTLDMFSDDLEQPTVSEEDLVYRETKPQVDAKEFKGDYVLEEETTDEFILEQPDTAVDIFDPDEDINANLNEFPQDVSEGTGLTDNITTAEVELWDDENTVIEDSDLSQTALDDTEILGGEAVASAYLVRERLEQPTEHQELDDRDTIIDRNYNVSTEAIADKDIETTSNDLDTSLEEITFNEVENADDTSLDEFSLEQTDNAADIELNNLTLDRTDDSTEISLEEITFDDVENAPDASLDEIRLEQSDPTAEINLDDLTFDDVENAPDASLDEISLEHSDSTAEINLDDLTFDDVENAPDASLDEVSLEQSDPTAEINVDDLTFDDVENAPDASLDEVSLEETGSSGNSIDVSLDNTDTTRNDQNVSLDDSTYDPLGDRTAEITNLDDESNDMDNISEWLDSLETSERNTDNISEWLEQLKVDDDYVAEDSNNNEEIKLEDETENVSFQFLDDLLEEDSDPNRRDR